MSGFDACEKLLGKYTIGKPRLYVKRLEDVDLDTPRELTWQAVEHAAQANE
jgi:hypothetical protein